MKQTTEHLDARVALELVAAAGPGLPIARIPTASRALRAKGLLSEHDTTDRDETGWSLADSFGAGVRRGWLRTNGFVVALSPQGARVLEQHQIVPRQDFVDVANQLLSRDPEDVI